MFKKLAHRIEIVLWASFYNDINVNRKTARNIQGLVFSFSLVEVIVVIALVSMLSIFSAISFSSITPKNLETQTRKLANDLRWVRDMAYARHRNFIVEFLPGQKQYLIYKDSISTANFLERRSLDVGSMAIVPTGSTQLQFNYPKGTAASNMQILLSQGAETNSIIVFNETGYVYLQ